MSADLIPGVVGITLGVVVIVAGLRRDLGSVTRSWLPEFETGTAMAESGGSRRGRRPLTLRQRQLLVGFYVLLSGVNVVEVFLSADDRLLRVTSAVVFGIGAAVLALRGEKGPEVDERRQQPGLA